MLGPAGDGPGEFGAPAAVQFIGPDSILVLDLRKQRGTVLSAKLTVSRTFSLAWAGQLSSFALIGRTVVGAGFLATPENAGFPLHFMSIDGSSTKVLTSIGNAPESGLSGLARGRERYYEWRLAAGRNNMLWSADIRQYRIVQWSMSGAPLRKFIRKPAWFKDTSTAMPRGNRTPPDPVMRAIAEDSTGLLWVAALSASPNWKDGWATRPPPGTTGAKGMSDATPSSIRDLLKLYMTNVEVLDPTTARLVASLSIPETLVSLLPGRRAAIYSEDPDGYPVLKIVEFTLAGR
jgi:hypothetical protein